MSYEKPSVNEQGDVIPFKKDDKECNINKDISPQYAPPTLAVMERRMQALEQKEEKFKEEGRAVKGLLREVQTIVEKLERNENAQEGSHTQNRATLVDEIRVGTLQKMQKRHEKVTNLLKRVRERNSCLYQLKQQEGSLQLLQACCDSDNYQNRFSMILSTIENLREMLETYEDVSEEVRATMEEYTLCQRDSDSEESNMVSLPNRDEASRRIEKRRNEKTETKENGGISIENLMNKGKILSLKEFIESCREDIEDIKANPLWNNETSGALCQEVKELEKKITDTEKEIEQLEK